MPHEIDAPYRIVRLRASQIAIAVMELPSNQLIEVHGDVVVSAQPHFEVVDYFVEDGQPSSLLLRSLVSVTIFTIGLAADGMACDEIFESCVTPVATPPTPYMQPPVARGYRCIQLKTGEEIQVTRGPLQPHVPHFTAVGTNGVLTLRADCDLLALVVGVSPDTRTCREITNVRAFRGGPIPKFRLPGQR